MKIILEGAKETAERMKQYPQEFNNALERFMTLALLLIWESVPSYPSQLPTKSGYIRTGTLGRSLGIGSSAQGASIYEVRQNGSGMASARFGTNLEYATYVIGDADSEQSEEMQRRGWWTLPQDVLSEALPKIEEQWQRFTEQIAQWLEGNG